MNFLVLQAGENLTEELTQDLEKYSNGSFWKSLDPKEVGLKILFGLLFFILGYILIQVISHFINRLLKKTKASTSGIYYIDKILKFLMYFVLIVIVLNNLGIQTGSLVALIASLGFAVALALQGSLNDLASGIMIVTTRPIRVG